jgi:hypothetical protein
MLLSIFVGPARERLANGYSGIAAKVSLVCMIVASGRIAYRPTTQTVAPRSTLPGRGLVDREPSGFSSLNQPLLRCDLTASLPKIVAVRDRARLIVAPAAAQTSNRANRTYPGVTAAAKPELTCAEVKDRRGGQSPAGLFFGFQPRTRFATSQNSRCRPRLTAGRCLPVQGPIQDDSGLIKYSERGRGHSPTREPQARGHRFARSCTWFCDLRGEIAGQLQDGGQPAGRLEEQRTRLDIPIHKLYNITYSYVLSRVKTICFNQGVCYRT